MSLEDRRKERIETSAEEAFSNEKRRLDLARKNLIDGIATPAERKYLKTFLKSAYKKEGDLAKERFTEQEKKLLKLDVADKAKKKFKKGEKLTFKEARRLKKDVRRRSKAAREFETSGLYLEGIKQRFDNTFEENVKAGILDKRGGLSRAEQKREMQRIYGRQGLLSTDAWINLFFLFSIAILVLGAYFTVKKAREKAAA